MQEKPSSSDKIFNLDNQANELGMGGKLSPESDESSYKKRMQQRNCLLYTSPSPRDSCASRMPSSA